MGRRSRKKRGERKTGERSPHQFTARVVELEVAKGYDGPLRGDPEPVLLLAGYVVIDGEARMIARHIFRMACPLNIPGRVEGPEEKLEVKRPRLDSSELIVVVAAIEEDDQTGLREIYAAFERAQDLWLLDETGAEARHLHELQLMTSPRFVRAIPRLERTGLDDLCVGDDFVDAAYLVVPRGVWHDEVRLHARSSDGKNDWTIRLQIDSR